jgi:hypothetical protein
MLTESVPFSVCNNDKQLRCAAAALVDGREGHLFQDKIRLVVRKRRTVHAVSIVPSAAGEGPHDECLFEVFPGDMTFAEKDEGEDYNERIVYDLIEYEG